MTWEEWVDSSYCTGNFRVRISLVFGDFDCRVALDSEDVSYDDLILSGGVYSLEL